jgi:predicted GIY-YIG superfamily endonuclease
MKKNIRACGIYCIENISNNKKYFGKSVDLLNRLDWHKNRLARNVHTNSHLQLAWNKYGKTSFNFW